MSEKNKHKSRTGHWRTKQESCTENHRKQLSSKSASSPYHVCVCACGSVCHTHNHTHTHRITHPPTHTHTSPSSWWSWTPLCLQLMPLHPKCSTAHWMSLYSTPHTPSWPLHSPLDSQRQRLRLPTRRCFVVVLDWGDGWDGRRTILYHSDWAHRCYSPTPPPMLY